MAAGDLRLRLKRVNVDRAQLVAPGNPVYRAVERAGAAALAAVQEATPVRSGDLKEAWIVRLVQTPTRVLAEIVVSPSAPYSGTTPPAQYVRYVVFGTNGPIRSSSGKQLKILNQGGGVTFRDEVAGQAANDFPARALRTIRKQSFEV